MVTLGAPALDPFPRFARYNSPYTAHRDGRAIDLYPGTKRAPSPVAGTVVETRTMTAPSRSYAAPNDHLIVIDTGTELARILHVDPAVEAGTTIERGEDLGPLVRSGYFAPWVDNHVHLGFRAYGTDPVRASGSLRVALDVPLHGLTWDGTGTVRAVGDTYVILDAPVHPDPGGAFAGIADDTGHYVFDGGVPHYETGGVHATDSDRGSTEPISLLGTTLAPGSGTIDWESVAVFANGREITGLSFLLGRDQTGAKLICPNVEFAVGETVTVEIA
ncbi:hypothetical protein [Halodesulfurarchaeum sp.]|uniref:hypothetical protein n=1 Tax=Halodesulfurarchaeum sp. TaxID=1980530 RepID=UPI001BBC196D|nr:hypothetical protein [Halodesulfurarchaeum sp.]